MRGAWARPGRARAGLAALAALGALAAGAARGQPPVWTVHGPRGEIVLFGSVHMLPPGVDWRPPALTAALARADQLWFELPLDAGAAEAVRDLVRRLGALPPGDSLWAHMDAARRADVKRAAAQVGVSAEALAPMRPWMADLALSVAADAAAGARPGEGVEARLAADAPPAARRLGLETASEQIGFLAAGDTAEQVASLDETAREITGDPGLFARVLAAWLSGDVAALDREALGPLRAQAPASYRRLIVERNRRWARVLTALAAEPGVKVVVVGAGHLVGRDGLPARLRARGLKVDGP